MRGGWDNEERVFVLGDDRGVSEGWGQGIGGLIGGL